MTLREEQIGICRLILGDSREVVSTLGAVDVVLTDPPYGDTETHAKHLSTVRLRSGSQARSALGFNGITGADLTAMARQWCDLARRWVVFSCEWKHAHLLDEAGVLVRLGIWRKPDGAPQFTGDRPGTGWEAVAICHRPGRKRWNGGGSHAFWSVPKAGRYGHPTEKPEGLLSAWVRDFSDPGEVVLDPFMGSGTSVAVAARMGRPAIGIERDPFFFEIACRRVEQALRQSDLFVSSPAMKQRALF